MAGAYADSKPKPIFEVRRGDLVVENGITSRVERVSSDYTRDYKVRVTMVVIDPEGRRGEEISVGNLEHVTKTKGECAKIPADGVLRVRSIGHRRDQGLEGVLIENITGIKLLKI